MKILLHNSADFRGLYPLQPPHRGCYPNTHSGKQRITLVFMAGYSVGQTRHQVLPHVGDMLYPAVNVWRILLSSIAGVEGQYPHEGGLQRAWSSALDTIVIDSVYNHNLHRNSSGIFRALLWYWGQDFCQ